MSDPTAPERPLVFLLPGLGLDAATFAPLVAALGDGFEAVAVDLPGFGDRPVTDGTSVAEMAGVVEDVIRSHRPGRFLLVGHSMGGKVATVVAARILSGTARVFGLAGVVLLAGSPPSPEPMDDQVRGQMLGWALADGPDAAAARTFVDDNVGAALPAELDALATSAVTAGSSEAWLAWLTRGSTEDWSTTVGTLDLPAVLLAGGADGPLGEAGQREHNAPVYPRAAVTTLAGAGHFLHLERPAEVATEIRELWAQAAGLGPVVPPDVVHVLASDRVAARTRGALARRAVADDPAYAPQVLTTDQLATLRAVAARVVPQDGRGIDLAARVDSGLAGGETDGWRPADLPPDSEAYAAALDALADFVALDNDEQDALLGELAAGEASPPGRLSASQLQSWFEDMSDDLVRRYVMHPATLARIGFDGFALGGDRARQTGFVELRIGRAEAWEPAAVVAS